ncbi:MAG: hypothetical protein HQL36_11170 [Alphaproteobacteria bacterium]|nr:hypothetical protein [Alphaproteobacteria bacterium]
MTDINETGLDTSCQGRYSERRGTCRALHSWLEHYTAGSVPLTSAVSIADDFPDMCDNMFLLKLVFDPLKYTFVYSGPNVDAFCGRETLGKCASETLPEGILERFPYATRAMREFKHPISINESLFFNGQYILCRLMLMPLS